MQAKALLANRDVAGFEKAIVDFCDSVVPENGFISKNFHDIYYSAEENAWLDGALKNLSCIEDEQDYAEIYYCLQQSCVQKRPFNLFHRRNYYLRVNNNRQTKFGNWATWERGFKELMIRAAKDLVKARFVSSFDPVILPSINATEIPVGYDLVYLDPPYIPLKRNDISYLERYHFLEGLASPEQWVDRIDWSKEHKCFKSSSEFKSWHTRSVFKERLFELVRKHRQSIVVLSYVMDAYPAAPDIEELFLSVFKEVKVYKKSLSHALASKAKVELLIIGVP